MFDFVKGRIGLILSGRYPHCHTLAVDDSRRVLIDAASDRDKLMAFHRQGNVDILITTHAHEDHLIYNSLFPDAGLWVHELDALPFSDIHALISQYGLTAEETAPWEEFLVKDCTYAPRSPTRLLKDRDILDFGRTYAVVIHAPGHTPGHCCLHFPLEGVLFLSDYDLVPAGPYYGDVSSSLEQTIASLEKLSTIKADVYLTAHGKGVFDASPGLIADYLDIVFQRESKLIDLLSERPRTLDEVTDAHIIYGKPKALGAWDLSVSERMMMRKHLQRLVDQDRVHEADGRYHLAK